MITFILNNEKISTENPSGGSLLDFIRYEMGLSGTKAGCREGDCGACTVLMGTIEDGVISYRNIVSCLTPLINVHGKHIVTIEGINSGHLSPVQKAFVDNSATQCGFCTPGFVMSLTANSMAPEKSTIESTVASLSGNICRCTGYKSIERAAETIAEILKDKDINDPIRWLVDHKYLPGYFLSVPERLNDIIKSDLPQQGSGFYIAGGTDLMVQKAEELAEADISTFQERKELKGIKIEGGRCIIGAATTITEAGHSDIIKKIIPEIHSFLKLVASEPIRNMATIAGNIINASPIGDLTIMLLALNADLIIDGPENISIVPLREFFVDYKKLIINENEYIRSIRFKVPPEPILFNFEKVSKRTHLDIASVNTAILIKTDGVNISECNLSAGGVSPIPLLLTKTGDFLRGKLISTDNILQANKIMQGEVSPISDVRGSKEYKRLLLRQLLFAHFVRLFPGKVDLSALSSYE